MTTPYQPGIGQKQVALLMDLLLDLRGHPRLSAWEEGFVSDMQHRLELLGGTMQVSTKQWAVLDELREKTAARLPDDLDEGPDPDRDMDLEPELVGALEEE